MLLLRPLFFMLSASMAYLGSLDQALADGGRFGASAAYDGGWKDDRKHGRVDATVDASRESASRRRARARWGRRDDVEGWTTRPG